MLISFPKDYASVWRIENAIFQFFCEQTQSFLEETNTFARECKSLVFWGKYIVFPQETLRSLVFSCRSFWFTQKTGDGGKTVAMPLRANAQFLRETQSFCKRKQVLQANAKFLWETRNFENFAFARKSIEKFFLHFVFQHITWMHGISMRIFAFAHNLNWKKLVLLWANAEFLREKQSFCKRTRTFCERTQSF